MAELSSLSAGKDQSLFLCEIDYTAILAQHIFKKSMKVKIICKNTNYAAFKQINLHKGSAYVADLDTKTVLNQKICSASISKTCFFPILIC